MKVACVVDGRWLNEEEEVGDYIEEKGEDADEMEYKEDFSRYASK